MMKKTNPSLRRRLLWYVTVTGMVLVLFSIYLLGYYFLEGRKVNTKYMLEMDAKDYAQRYQDDSDAPLPDRAHMHAYRSIEDIPQGLLALFPQDEHVHRYMADLDTTFLFDDAKWQLLSELSGLCRGIPCELIFFYAYQLHDGQWLYLVLASSDDDYDKVQNVDFERMLYFMLPIALLFLLVMLGLAFVLMREVSKPIAGVSDWADRLALDDLGKPVPDFRFRELDIVAGRLHGAFERIGQVLDNEHRFLRDASHELRTPLAVMSSNLELLDKLSEKDQRPDSEQDSIARLKRAVLNMQQLTETLLWLSRDEANMPAPESVALDSLVTSLVDDSRYLLEGKNVSVNTRYASSDAELPVTPCRIVLANLIRNAFQYTREGTVDITVEGASVTVSNHCASQHGGMPRQADYGFGLGLKLVEQITDKLGWRYEMTPCPNGRTTTIVLDAS